MQKDELNDLIKRYLNGTCTDEERRIVEQLYENASDDSLARSLGTEQSEILFEKISGRLHGAGEQRSRSSRYRWLAAAGILVFIGVGLLFLHSRQEVVKSQQTRVAANDLSPGGNKAILTLANGRKIVLNGAARGTLAQQGKVKIIKLNDGELKYNEQDRTASAIGFNTVSTPAGGKYEVVLPDGTHVWLNALSSVKFPSAFTGAERDVTLTGEAYFEVAKNKQMPFKVKVGDNTVEVLGTHFNIMAYNDESVMKTTLLEGSVKISTPSSSGMLKPSQQAVVGGSDGLSIKNIDTEPEVAWKNDLFWFDNTDIQTIMRQLARWYDVDIKYQGDITQKFSGTIPRNLTASKVFAVLEQTGKVHFRVQGKQIIVSP